MALESSIRCECVVCRCNRCVRASTQGGCCVFPGERQPSALKDGGYPNETALASLGLVRFDLDEFICDFAPVQRFSLGAPKPAEKRQDDYRKRVGRVVDTCVQNSA